MPSEIVKEFKSFVKDLDINNIYPQKSYPYNYNESKYDLKFITDELVYCLDIDVDDRNLDIKEEVLKALDKLPDEDIVEIIPLDLLGDILEKIKKIKKG